MIKVERVIINEDGKQVKIEIKRDQRGTRVSAKGPTPETDHRWSIVEVLVLRDMLNELVTTHDDGQAY